MTRLPHPRASAITALALGLAITGLVTAWQVRSNQAEAQARLNDLAARAVDAVSERMHHYKFGLLGTRGAILATGAEAITRERFQAYSGSRDYDEEFPGARGFGVIWRVTPEREPAFVAGARNDGWPDFKIRQLAPYDGERFVIQYIEPVERNRQAVGLDVASEDNRRGAALRAMRSGEPALSGPITLVQATGLPLRSFLLMLPIYKPGASLGTEEERERACIGWSYAPLVINEVLNGLDLSSGQLTIELLDLGEEKPTVFYQSPTKTETSPKALARTVSFNMFGRDWSAQLSPTPAFYKALNQTDPFQVATVLAGLAVLLAAIVHLVATGRIRKHQVQFEQARRAAIIEGSPDAIIIESLDGQVMDWNPGAESMFGYTAQEAIGKRVADLLLPYESARVDEQRILGDIQDGRAVQPFECTRRCRDGKLLHVSIAVAPLMAADGACVGLSKVIRDNSATRLAQDALAQLNDDLERLVTERTAALDEMLHDFRNIMDALPSMIGYWDRDLINRVANKAYGDWFGIDPSQVPGQSMRELLGDDTFELNRPYVEAVLRGESQTFERTIPSRDGSSVRHAIAYYLPDLVDGEVKGFYVLVHDLTELTESRQQLAAAQRDTAALLQTIHQHSIVSVADRAGNIIDVNDNFCTISGYSREELLGMNHRLVNSGSHEGVFWEEMWSTISSGKSWRGEVCNKARDGAIYWVDSVIAPFFGVGGEIEKFISIRTDITERKRLQNDVAVTHQRLEASERFLRNITDNLPVRIAYLDREGRFQFVNATYCKYLGRSREAILGKTREDLFASTDTMDALPLYDAVLKGEPQRLEYDELMDGRKVCLDTHLVPDVAESGVVHGLYMVSTDITERRKAERELRETMALLNAVLAAASQVSIIAVKPDGLISIFNTGAESLLGYSSEEVIGKMTSLQFHNADEMRVRAQALSERFGRKVHTGEVLIDPEELGRSNEWTYRRKDGQSVPVLLGVTAMRDDQGNLAGYLGIAHDVRPQKEQERSLREAVHRAKKANQAKTQFLANMSHEIRTPMNAVIGLSYLLERTELDADQASFLAKIKLASKSLLSLINGILDLSKIEAGELKIEHAPFSLNALLQEVCEIVSVQSDAKGIGFDAGVPANLPAMMDGDATRLHQILTNLLTNAIKFTESGSVRLRVTQVGAKSDSLRLRFVIKDSGIGMTAEQVGRLFTPFAQADASTTRRFGGTGLGLSIVKQLVQLMEGELGLDSTPGRGSEFWFELNFGRTDCAALPKVVPDNGGQPVAGLHGVRVLVADDSEINLEVARSVLELEGARVSLACNGQGAVDQLLASPGAFDVVLLDLQMPVLDGFDACRRIRSGLGLKSLPIIALSASTLSSEMSLAQEAGMNDFISKPFDAHQLVQRIRQWVGAASRVTAVESGTRNAGAISAPEIEHPPAAWPEIDGVSSAEARKRLGGDQNLFFMMLKRLVGEFSDLGQDDQALKLDALPEMAARLHKLKGSAGTLGAAALENAAAQADAACRCHQAEQAQLLLADVAAQLQRIKASTAPFLQSRAADQRSVVKVAALPHGLSRLDMAGLILMLAHSDLDAIERFASLAPALESALGPDAFARLRDQIDNLNFEAAADVLNLFQQRVTAEVAG